MSCGYGSSVDQSARRDNYGSLRHFGRLHEPINPLLPIDRLEDQIRMHNYGISTQGSYIPSSQSPNSAEYAVSSKMYRAAQFPALSTSTMTGR